MLFGCKKCTKTDHSRHFLRPFICCVSFWPLRPVHVTGSNHWLICILHFLEVYASWLILRFLLILLSFCLNSSDQQCKQLVWYICELFYSMLQPRFFTNMFFPYTLLTKISYLKTGKLKFEKKILSERARNVVFKVLSLAELPNKKVIFYLLRKTYRRWASEIPKIWKK